MSKYAYPSTSGKQDSVTTELPTMVDFISTLRHALPYADQLPKTCGICWDDVRWDGIAVACLPCDHIFHRDCCLKWVGSTAENRNSCPECRKEFCLLNTLTPEQEATIRVSEVEYNEGMSPFHTEAYSWLLQQSDLLYEKEKAKETSRPDFVSVIRDARMQWQAKWQANDFICDEHAAVGNDWIELVTANRVQHRLSEDSLIDSWEGQAFTWVHTELINLVNQGFVDSVGEVWEEFPQNGQGEEEMDTEDAEADEDFQPE